MVIFVKNWLSNLHIGAQNPLTFQLHVRKNQCWQKELDAKFKDEMEHKEFPDVSNTPFVAIWWKICEGIRSAFIGAILWVIYMQVFTSFGCMIQTFNSGWASEVFLWMILVEPLSSTTSWLGAWWCDDWWHDQIWHMQSCWILSCTFLVQSAISIWGAWNWCNVQVSGFQVSNVLCGATLWGWRNFKLMFVVGRECWSQVVDWKDGVCNACWGC
jgi:hypothetical protein